MSGIQQMLLAASSVSTLDAYTTNIWSVISMRKLIGSYSGSCVRIRRSSDNTEQDIGFSGGLIDQAAAVSFCGAGDGFVVRGYDQSGSGNDFIQTATTARQPKLVSSGSFNASGQIEFDGTDDWMESANNSGTPNGMTAFIKGKLRAVPNMFNMYLEHTADGVTNSGISAYYNLSTTNLVESVGPNANRASSFYSLEILNDNVHAYNCNRAAVGGAAVARLFVNGVAKIRTGNGDSGTVAGNFDAAKWNLGARTAASIPAQLNLKHLVIYQASKSDPDTAAISAILAN